MTNPDDRSVSEPRTLHTHPELHSRQSFPMFEAVPGGPPKGPLERFLSIFADVRAGEGPNALLLAFNVFLLLGAYYMLKPAREALILAEYGAEQKAYAAAAQAILLIGIVPLYGWLGTRIPRMPLMATTAVFFASNLVLFYLLGQAGFRLGVVFYVWLGIFNVFVVSQFWAFANDLYTEGQGRRLFPLVGVGASLGAWVGAATVEPLIEGLAFTPFTLMVAGAAILVVALGVTFVVNRRAVSRTPENARTARQTLGKEGGFELVLKDRYLTWIAVLIVLLNVVNSTGEYLLGSVITANANALFPDVAQLDESRAYVGSFYGSFYATVNLVGFLLQLLVASRAIRYLGVRGSLFILPILALVNYSVIAVAPLLAVIRVGKILENSTDYSIQNTVRQALFLPTSREAKYKAKAAIDTFGTRFGDVASAGVVLGGTAMGAATGAFAWFTVGLTVIWLGVAGRIAKEHRKKTV
jgi:AAA family ATP:ADP antiporter